MKVFKVGSYQLLETKKWAPSGVLFDYSDGSKVGIQEADIFPPNPEFRFDTKEDADEYFRNYFIKLGYSEK